MPFNVIVDTDMGLMKLIQFEYYNDTYFNMGLIDTTDSLQQFTAAMRPQENIMVSLCSDACSEEMVEDFTNQFFSKEYDQILSLSPMSQVMKIIETIKLMHSERDVRIDVLCSSEKEKQLLERRQIPVNIVMGDFSTVDMNNYDALFVKCVYDLTIFGDLERKVIYVPNYKFNVIYDGGDPNKPLIVPDIFQLYGIQNDFKVYEAYTFEESELPVL